LSSIGQSLPSIRNDSTLEEKSMSKLLINEAPIMIIPSLAVKIGLNETIVLQQIHYWLQSSSHVIEGRKWIYNTYQDWQEQMPFWSKDTICRAIRSLEKQGLLLTGNWNKKKSDNTKWYSINYQNLDALEGFDSEEHDQPSQHVESPSNLPTSTQQIAMSDLADCQLEDSNLPLPLPESTSEITTEKNLIVDIVDYFNAKTNANYKSASKKTRKHIRARLREGFTFEDFKRVIDRKTADWLDDPHMNQYLRPETLFGTKFESYLNQQSAGKSLFEKSTRGIPATYQEEDFDLHD
jgi:uncharacterized phage protein (TIGR02220 family)